MNSPFSGRGGMWVSEVLLEGGEVDLNRVGERRERRRIMGIDSAQCTYCRLGWYLLCCRTAGRFLRKALPLFLT